MRHLYTRLLGTERDGATTTSNLLDAPYLLPRAICNHHPRRRIVKRQLRSPPTRPTVVKRPIRVIQHKVAIPAPRQLTVLPFRTACTRRGTRRPLWRPHAPRSSIPHEIPVALELHVETAEIDDGGLLRCYEESLRRKGSLRR